MFSYEKQKKSAIIPLTVLAGVVIGSVVTLLFAPRKGSSCRQWIRNKAGDVKGLFSNAILDDLNSDSPILCPTMHAVKADTTEDSTSSKAAAMVSHLKHTRHDTGGHTKIEPV